MLGEARNAISDVYAREISRFMSLATEKGHSDLNVNRRGSMRHHQSWPMFVARLDAGESEDISVTMHDISSEGIGFFSDSGFPVGCTLGIKLFWSDPSALRIPVIVKHNEITQRGVLVGAQFAINDPGACGLAGRGVQWYG